MWEAKHFQPAIDERARARCYNTPSCAGSFEGCEEFAAAGDLDGVGAIFFRDATFDFIDICGEKMLSVYILC